MGHPKELWSCPKELLSEPEDSWSTLIISSPPLMEAINKGIGLLGITNKV
jgi:hypothetical protein